MHPGFEETMKNIVRKLVTVLLATGSFLLLVGTTAFAKENLILDGIYIGDFSVGGMTEEEARETVEEYIADLGSKDITLKTVNDEKILMHPSEIGFYWANSEVLSEAANIGHSGNVVARYKAKKDLAKNNVVYPITVGIDEGLLEKFLNEKCAQYDTEAEKGLLTMVDGEFVIDQGQIGASLDVAASKTALSDFLCNEWNGGSLEYPLVINVDDPEGSFGKLSLVKDVLGAFHTNFKSSGASRSANVKNGARLINGSLIYPGEEFSFYDHIKPFTAANGYQMAAAYSAGKVVDSIGGGICQVSSTLYNSVLLAELEVTERRNHAMIVGYVDPARDATIAESSGIDFRFVNNTDAPIYIDAYTTDEKELYITIYGHETRSPERVLEYETEILSRTVPETENVYPDYSLPVGSVQVQSAHIGYKANLWKVVTENGETTRELVNTSSYTPTPKYATVGMATSDPNIAAKMEAAVASGSIATAKAAAAECKAAAAAGTTVKTPEQEALEQYQAALAAQQGAN